LPRIELYGMILTWYLDNLVKKEVGELMQRSESP